MTQYVKYVDMTKCDGCRGCMIACKNWNDLEPDPFDFIGIQSHERLTAETWNYIRFHEKINKELDSGVDWYMGHMSCLHCEEAPCQKACPEKAISTTAYGSVIINHERCTGCGYCAVHCPFDVVELGWLRGENGGSRPVAKKCTLCTDRISHGEEPACVFSCHSDSLQYGKRDEIMTQAKARLDVVRDRYPNANIYEGVDGGFMIYLLEDKPEIYGLPIDTKVPLGEKIWKDYAHPLGKILMGATATAVLAGIVSNYIFNPRAKKGYQPAKTTDKGTESYDTDGK